MEKANNKIKKLNIIPLFLLTILLLNTSFTARVQATGAIVEIDIKEGSYPQDLSLDVIASIPTVSSSYEIRINCNKEAFDYKGTDFNDDFGKKRDAILDQEGILSLEVSGGEIPLGENKLATIHLKAKQAGLASILIVNSKFFDANGNEISGTMLKYYTLEIDFEHNENNNTTNDSHSNKQNSNASDEPVRNENSDKTDSSEIDSSKTTNTLVENDFDKIDTQDKNGSDVSNSNADTSLSSAQENNNFKNVNNAETSPTNYLNIISYILIAILALLAALILVLIIRKLIISKKR